jgi:hypothetical protein
MRTNMEIIIIGASVLAFLVYIFFYKYFGIDARIQMFVLHLLIVAFIGVLVVLLIISVIGDYSNFAVVSAIAALTGYGTIVLKYIFTELLGRRV